MGNDDQAVQDKAIKSMQRVGRLLDHESIEDTYLPMIERQKEGDLFSMRISACHLYANIYEKLDPTYRQ